MKTNLNRTIICTQDAIDYIKELIDNDEIYPLYVDAHYVVWIGISVSPEQRNQLNYLYIRCCDVLANPWAYACERISLMKFIANEN